MSSPLFRANFFFSVSHDLCRNFDYYYLQERGILIPITHYQKSQEGFMKKALIVYHSRTGKTEAMANYIGEGLRFCAVEVVLKKISEIDNELDIVGYDAYIFGCPTYHKDMTGGMKQFLFKAELANLVGKIGGGFGSHTHSGESAPMLFDTMMYVFKMDMTDLGPLKLTEDMVGSTAGIKACHDYGKAIGEKLVPQ